MFDIHRVELDWGGRKLILETGKVARQADGAVRVGLVNNEYVLNPQLDEMPESQLDLVVAGTQDAVLMVESEAKELSEEIMLGAVMFGHRHLQPIIDAIIKLAEKAAKEPREVTTVDNAALEKQMLGLVEK